MPLPSPPLPSHLGSLHDPSQCFSVQTTHEAAQNILECTHIPDLYQASLFTARASQVDISLLEEQQRQGGYSGKHEPVKQETALVLIAVCVGGLRIHVSSVYGHAFSACGDVQRSCDSDHFLMCKESMS